MPQLVAVPTPASGETRITFTSAEVGNGNANDSGTLTNQDGGLAVRVQAEAADGTLTGPVSRYTDEDIVFVAEEEEGGTFDVRDLVSGAARGNQFASVQLGTQGNDTLTAYDEERAAYINGGQGDDDIAGGVANDFLVGGAGDDTLAGGLGDDSLLGGGGDDTALLDASLDGSDTIDLGDGNDAVAVTRATAGQVRLTFTSAEVGNGNVNDGGTLANQDGGLAVRIQAENDAGTLDGDVSRAEDEGITFVADDGVTFDVRDLVSGVQRGDQFRTASLGTAAIDEIAGTTEADYVNAGAGDDIVRGLAGNDFLVGGAGNDTLDGGTGVDGLLGGAGNDTYGVDNANDRVIEAVGGGNDTVEATASYRLAAGQEIETLRLATPTGTAALDLNGNEFDQTLVGNDGDNTLDGRGGDDVLIGRAGNDIYGVDSANDRVVEAVGGGNDTVFARTSYRLEAGQEIERLQLLASTGTAAFDLNGNEFDQTLVGNQGDNTLDGRGGDDVLIGRGGDDIYGVDSANDRVVEAVGGGDDIVFARTSFRLEAGQEIEALQLLASTGTAAFDLNGNEFDQRLVGNIGNNTLDGRGGDDVLIGRGGDDIYGVDSANDQVIEAAGGGNDTVFARTSYSLAAGQEIETLRLLGSTGTANLDLTGNAFGQTLVGNRGDNTLDGRGGADVLTGGQAADTFVFSTALGNGNVDRITDFSGADDTIQLSAAIFTALSAGDLDDAAFKDVGAGGTVDGSDRILYDSRTGALSYDADGSGSAAAVRFATLDNKAALSADDFIVA